MRLSYAENGPYAPQRMLVEEADATDSNGHGGTGIVFDVFEVEEMLAQLILTDQVR